VAIGRRRRIRARGMEQCRPCDGQLGSGRGARSAGRNPRRCRSGVGTRHD
jgi:hypothetical protein